MNEHTDHILAMMNGRAASGDANASARAPALSATSKPSPTEPAVGTHAPRLWDILAAAVDDGHLADMTSCEAKTFLYLLRNAHRRTIDGNTILMVSEAIPQIVQGTGRNCGRSAVISAMKRLRQKGLIKQSHRGNKRCGASMYTMHVPMSGKVNIDNTVSMSGELDIDSGGIMSGKVDIDDGCKTESMSGKVDPYMSGDLDTPLKGKRGASAFACATRPLRKASASEQVCASDVTLNGHAPGGAK